MNGNLKQADELYSESLKYNKMLSCEYHNLKKDSEVDILGALYFIFIRLGDYDQAIKNFQELQKKADSLEIKGKPYLIYIKSCLSLANNEIGNNEESFQYLIEALPKKDFLLKSQKTWIKVYGLYNLGKMLTQRNFFEEAINTFEGIIKDSPEYTLFKGMYNLGLSELYCIKKDYDTALDYHFQSIEILDTIGAKCDLAEAYFQLALTYQAMGDQLNSQTYFDKALKLWGPEQIDAPKQIERVTKAMQTIPE